MKTPAEIKTALNICGNDFGCSGCPYDKSNWCEEELYKDVLSLIEDLEERIAIMTEGSGEQDENMG